MAEESSLELIHHPISTISTRFNCPAFPTFQTFMEAPLHNLHLEAKGDSKPPESNWHRRFILRHSLSDYSYVPLNFGIFYLLAIIKLGERIRCTPIATSRPRFMYCLLAVIKLGEKIRFPPIANTSRPRFDRTFLGLKCRNLNNLLPRLPVRIYSNLSL